MNSDSLSPQSSTGNVASHDDLFVLVAPVFSTKRKRGVLLC